MSNSAASCDGNDLSIRSISEASGPDAGAQDEADAEAPAEPDANGCKAEPDTDTTYSPFLQSAFHEAPHISAASLARPRRTLTEGPRPFAAVAIMVAPGRRIRNAQKQRYGLGDIVSFVDRPATDR